MAHEVVVIKEGNGEWYHGFYNPLQHKWVINENIATCNICEQVVENRIIK